MDPIKSRMQIASAQKMDPSGPQQGSSMSASKKSSFKDVMSQKTGEADAAQGAKGPQQADAAQKTQKTQKVEQAKKSEMTQKVDKFVKGIGDDQKRIDRMMARLSRGGDVSQVELLRVQSTTYRYAQRVDLATKVVEKTANGVKQMMNTQV